MLRVKKFERIFKIAVLKQFFVYLKLALNASFLKNNKTTAYIAKWIFSAILGSLHLTNKIKPV